MCGALARAVCAGVLAVCRGATLALARATHESLAIFEHGPARHRRTIDLAPAAFLALALTADHFSVSGSVRAALEEARTPDDAIAGSYTAPPTAVGVTSCVRAAVGGCGEANTRQDGNAQPL